MLIIRIFYKLPIKTAEKADVLYVRIRVFEKFIPFFCSSCISNAHQIVFSF